MSSECNVQNLPRTLYWVIKDHVSTAHPESANLICEDCGLFFRSKLTVEFHQKMTHKSQLTHKEKDKKMWSCPICTNEFHSFRDKNDRGILFHLQTCESKLEKMTKGCLKCDRVFDVKILTNSAYTRFKDHINNCRQLILCEICGESFKGKPAIKNHRIQHHTEDCICQYCNRYLQPQNLKRHIEKEHYCDICQNHMEYQKECYHLGVKRSRNRKEFKNPQIQCKYCDEMMDKNLLKTHMNRKHESKLEKEYLCTQCGKSFLTLNKLYIHLEADHFDPGIKKYDCVKCTKSFDMHVKLRKHMKVSHSPKNLQCLHCNQCFAVQQNLQRHMRRTHNKQYQCDKCEKSFGFKTSLDKHIKIVHIGLRPHYCTECNDQFKTKLEVQQHTKHCHDKTKPFECSKCRKNFYTSQLLQRHFERIHELKNCETCPYCKKQFSRLKVHLESCTMKVLRSERYKIQCQYCERRYLNKPDYNQHVKKVHCDFVM